MAINNTTKGELNCSTRAARAALVKLQSLAQLKQKNEQRATPRFLDKVVEQWLAEENNPIIFAIKHFSSNTSTLSTAELHNQHHVIQVLLECYRNQPRTSGLFKPNQHDPVREALTALEAMIKSTPDSELITIEKLNHFQAILNGHLSSTRPTANQPEAALPTPNSTP